MKLSFKEKAVILRQKGLSYSEISRQIPIAKSTLSSWLITVPISYKQKQRLFKKRLLSAYEGGQIRKQQRIKRIEKIKKIAIQDIEDISERDLWLLGIAFYWAEGAKEKVYKPGQGIIFSNSDPLMSKIFLKWLKINLKVSEDKIVFEIYIHESYKDRILLVREFWSAATGFPVGKFDRIYFKKNKKTTNR